jgi:hypothetical protein
MIVDEHIGIQGNGNQDTQSWYHSMEVNIMLDSAEICKSWLDAIARNQSAYSSSLYNALAYQMLCRHPFIRSRVARRWPVAKRIWEGSRRRDRERPGAILLGKGCCGRGAAC